MLREGPRRPLGSSAAVFALPSQRTVSARDSRPQGHFWRSMSHYSWKGGPITSRRKTFSGWPHHGRKQPPRIVKPPSNQCMGTTQTSRRNFIRHKRGVSSYTIIVQAPKHQHPPLPVIPRPITPSSSAEDLEALSLEADRKAEEQDALDRKLQELQQMMTNDALGLVTSRERKRSECGRRWPPASSSVPSLTVGGYHHREFAIPVSHGPSHVPIQVLQPAECIFWCGYGQICPVKFERSREQSRI